MSHGWRMRAYMDVLAASVRLWMILVKRGWLKTKRYRKPQLRGSPTAPAALLKESVQ